MKKIAVIFGGKLDLYTRWFNVFKEIENHFHCDVRRKGAYAFSTIINNTALNFYFCINPVRDDNYLAYFKYYKSILGKGLPPPANDIMKRVKNSNKILFLGLCGALCNNRKGNVQTPNLFKNYYFPNSYISKKQTNIIKPVNEVRINNFLCQSKNKKQLNVITTNLTLLPEFIEGGCRELISLSQKLSSFGGLVDKESYEIATHSNGIPIGLALMTSGILYHRNGMMRNKRSFTPNIQKFNKMMIKSITIALDRD